MLEARTGDEPGACIVKLKTEAEADDEKRSAKRVRFDLEDGSVKGEETYTYRPTLPTGNGIAEAVGVGSGVAGVDPTTAAAKRQRHHAHGSATEAEPNHAPWQRAFETPLSDTVLRNIWCAFNTAPAGSFAPPDILERYPVANIGAVQYGMMTAKELQKLAAAEVNKPGYGAEPNTVADPRLGAASGQDCGHCYQGFESCPGHPGYIQMSRPFLNQSQVDNMTTLLRCLCPGCCRLRVPEAHLALAGGRRKKNGLKWLKDVATVSSKRLNACPRCGVPKAEWRNVYGRIEIRLGDKQAILDGGHIQHLLVRVPDEDYRLLGLDPENNHPANAVLFLVPVLPPVARPADRSNVAPDPCSLHAAVYGTPSTAVTGARQLATMADGTVPFDDGITCRYHQMTLLACNIMREANPSKADQSAQQAEQLYEQITLNRLPPAATRMRARRAKRKVASIRARHCRKYGRFRRDGQGKRTSGSLRTVMSCKATGACNTVRIPSALARKLTTPRVVQPWNRQALIELCREGRVVRIHRRAAAFPRDMGRFWKVSIHPNPDTDVLLRKGQRMPVPLDPSDLRPGDIVQRSGPGWSVPKLLRVSLFHEPPNLEFGDICYVTLGDGDYAMFNRQPSFTVESTLTLQVVTDLGSPCDETALFDPDMDVPPLEEKLSAAMSNPVEEALRGDNDGDEVNGHGLPGPEERADAALLRFEQKVVTSQDSSPVARLIQDAVVVACILTHRLPPAAPLLLPNWLRTNAAMRVQPADPRLDRPEKPHAWLAARYATIAAAWRRFQREHPQDPFVLSVGDGDYLSTGQGMLSLILPADLTYTGPRSDDTLPPLPDDAPEEAKATQRRCGEPFRVWCGIALGGGRLRAPALSHGKRSLLQHLFVSHGAAIASRFLDNMQNLTAYLGRHFSYNLSLEDCRLPPELAFMAKHAVAEDAKRVAGLHRWKANDDPATVQARNFSELLGVRKSAETLLSTYLCGPPEHRHALRQAAREAMEAVQAGTADSCPVLRQMPALLVAPTPEHYRRSIALFEARRRWARERGAVLAWPDADVLCPDDFTHYNGIALLALMGLKVNITHLLSSMLALGQQMLSTGPLPVGTHGRPLPHFTPLKREITVMTSCRPSPRLKRFGLGHFYSKRWNISPDESDERIFRALQFRGLITDGNFVDGLPGEAFFAHSIVSRESVAGMAANTGPVGYALRQTVKRTENSIVMHDGSVRDHRGRIITLRYGTGCVDPKWYCHTAFGPQFADLHALAAMLRARASFGFGGLHRADNNCGPLLRINTAHGPAGPVQTQALAQAQQDQQEDQKGGWCPAEYFEDAHGQCALFRGGSTGTLLRSA